MARLMVGPSLKLSFPTGHFRLAVERLQLRQGAEAAAVLLPALLPQQIAAQARLLLQVELLPSQEAQLLQRALAGQP